MIYFIGAGPGDPDLITVKGKRYIDEADIIIYAGSLVNKELLKSSKNGADSYDSAGMTLEEVLDVMVKGTQEGKKIARVHTGDPSIFGAIREQLDELVDRLKSGYKENTPVAVVYKASWPEQKIVQGTLQDIAEKVKKEGIRKTALVVVGDFLGDEYELSKLYDKSFTHEFRSAGE
ncbi:MAG: cobalt-precorrin-4/precorrin-4 C(11)-methyltransferase [Clostridia bacterium]